MSSQYKEKGKLTIARLGTLLSGIAFSVTVAADDHLLVGVVLGRVTGLTTIIAGSASTTIVVGFVFATTYPVEKPLSEDRGLEQVREWRRRRGGKINLLNRPEIGALLACNYGKRTCLGEEPPETRASQKYILKTKKGKR